MTSETDEPPLKIMKIEKESYFSVVPILDPKVTCHTVPSTSFHALEISNKSKIGQVIKLLKELPENLRHLKRVGKDGKVLLAENFEDAQDIIEKLADSEITIDHVKLVQVPATKPLTRRQFENAKLCWATGFHPDKELEALLDNSFSTKQFNEYVDKWSQLSEEIGCCVVKDSKLISTGKCSLHPLGHPVMDMVQNLPERDFVSYIGTGCDVFLNSEPCAMCAMALVHFRVKRVFYRRNSQNGVFKEGRWQLHLEPLINHHYEVYRIKNDNETTDNLSICGNSK